MTSSSLPTILSPDQWRSAVAKGQQPVRGEMNGLERDYAAYLDWQKVAGGVLWWKYEAMKLQLAKKTTLTVDFFVMLQNLDLEAHETKSWWRDDARAKLKMAAEMFPFRFIGVQRSKDKQGMWTFEEFKP